MIATILAAARLCGAIVTLHGAEVSPQLLALLAVALLGLVAAAEADPAARAILVAAVAMLGCVGAIVCVWRMLS